MAEKNYGENGNLSSKMAEEVFGRGFEDRVSEETVNKYAGFMYSLEQRKELGVVVDDFVVSKTLRALLDKTGIPLYGEPIPNDPDGKYMTIYQLETKFGEGVAKYVDESLLNEYARLNLCYNLRSNGFLIRSKGSLDNNLEDAAAVERLEAEIDAIFNDALKQESAQVPDAPVEKKNLLLWGLGALVVLALIRK